MDKRIDVIDHTSVVPLIGTTEDICRVDVYDVS